MAYFDTHEPASRARRGDLSPYRVRGHSDSGHMWFGLLFVIAGIAMWVGIYSVVFGQGAIGRTVGEDRSAHAVGKSDANLAAAPAPAVAEPKPAETAAPAAQSASPEPGIYVVAAGDTMNAIASRHKMTLQRLLDANPDITDPTRIEVGQRIRIPQ